MESGQGGVGGVTENCSVEFWVGAPHAGAVTPRAISEFDVAPHAGAVTPRAISEFGAAPHAGAITPRAISEFAAAPHAGAIPARALSDRRPGVCTPRRRSTGRAPGRTGMLRNGLR